MSTRIEPGIKEAWDAGSLGDTFPGGIWSGSAPPKTPYPHVALTEVSPRTRRGGSSHSIYTEAEYQFSIYYRSGDSDPILEGDELLEVLFDVYSGAELELSNGQCLNFQWTGDHV